MASRRVDHYVIGMVWRCYDRAQLTTFDPERTLRRFGRGSALVGRSILLGRWAVVGLWGALGCVHARGSEARGPGPQPSTTDAPATASFVSAASPGQNPAPLPPPEVAPKADVDTRPPAVPTAGADAAAKPDPKALLHAALSEERYLDAWQLLQSKELDDLPARNWVEGVVAANLGFYERAVPALQAAKQSYPQLSSLVDPLLRRAQVEVADYVPLLPELAKSRDVGELLTVASRLLNDGHSEEAFRFVQRAAGFAGNSRSKQARVRSLRARIWFARGLPFGALIDYRWLAFSAPLEPESADADTQIALHFPSNPLNLDQRLARVTLFSDAGRIEETERELAAARLLPNFKLALGEELHLRAMARFNARDYAAAAELLQQAVDAKCNQAIGDAYRAGVSLSRVGRAREAISLFERVAGSTPKGSLTLAARFRIGSEWLALGEWQRALEAHSTFLDKNPGTEFGETAERERAVAWFALGESGRAASAFRKLRANHAASRDADLYQLLEAISLEHAGKPEGAIPLLNDLGTGTPLSFSGQMARQRLEALGQSVVPLVPSNLLPKPEGLPLPGLVQDLEHAGLRSWSEDALRLLEPSWLSGVTENRGYLQCQAYGQLETARRRFVIGNELGNKLSFWSHPREQEPWLWRCLYPSPFGDVVSRYSETWNVSPALVYAVMRQESGFHTTIRSPAAATGLMQIIEPTALRIAAELGEPAQIDRLQAPRDNIRFGIFYLRKLLALFDDHPAPAVAAYNAGPAAALRWQNAAKDLPVEMFIARIPYEETRTYVQKVLGNLQVYESLYPEFAKLEVPLTLGSNTHSPDESRDVPMDAGLY